MAVVRVKSTHPESQGPFVLIDDFSFDAAVHELFEPTEQEKAAVAALAPAAEPAAEEVVDEPASLRWGKKKK
jgi:hypothetical protein